jgi:leader peptidase (prepilin peptidase)/N-methyltransferase
MIAALVLLVAAFLGWTAHRLAMALVDGPGWPPGAAATIGAAVLMAAFALAVGPPAPAGLLLGWALLVLAASDLAAMRLPDAVTLPLIVAGLTVAGAGVGGARPAVDFSLATLRDHAIGAAAGYMSLWAVSALYRRARDREGLGLGDAKLAACGGAWLGWRALPLMVLIACAAAFVWVALRWAREGRTAARTRLPFGPPLALALWILWLEPGWIG